MRSRQSFLSLVKDALLRVISASAMIFVMIAIIATFRGISQGITYPLVGDDWYLVAGFLSAWCAIPAILTTIFTGIVTRAKNFNAYTVIAISQMVIFYGYCHYVTTLPDNELSSSPIILLVYAALPIALGYYPLYFSGNSWGNIRGVFSMMAVGLIGYACII